MLAFHTHSSLWFFRIIAVGCFLPLTAGAKIDFNREVRPILSEKCFTCHGFDEKERKANLRLDVREHALNPAKSGETAIVPGKVDASELIKRIVT